MSKLKTDSAVVIGAAVQMAQLIATNLVGMKTSETIGDVALTPEVMAGLITSKINARITETTQGIK